MFTNLHLNDQLIDKAVKLGGHCTKKAAVTEALEQYVQYLEQQKVQLVRSVRTKKRRNVR